LEIQELFIFGLEIEKQTSYCTHLEIILLCPYGSSAMSQTPSREAALAPPNTVLQAGLCHAG